MKKLNKFFAVLVALAMMATLCVTAAFAYDGDDERVGEIDTAVLTKYLKLPSGVTIPTKTFEFEVSKVTTDAPDLKTTADLDVATSEMTASASPADGSSLVGNIDIGTWFDAEAFPHAGKYTYEVEESVPAAAKANEYKEQVGDSEDEVLQYSQAKYTLDFYVTVDAQGNKTIDAIVATDENGQKVDITDEDPTDPNATEDNVTDANAEGATFVNEYKDLGNTPDDPTEIDPTNDDYGDLGIKKVVTGTYGDKNAQFKFNVTVNKPAAGYPVDTVDAYYYNNGVKGEKVTFTFDQAKTIDLRDGQALAFLNLPNGATYAITEDLANTTTVTPAEYKASYVTKTQAAAAEEATTSEAVEASAAGVSLELAAANKKAIDNTDKVNSVIYTNDSQVDDTPTGILISNLPYIALALVAIGGLVAYVVVRRRQNDEA